MKEGSSLLRHVDGHVLNLHHARRAALRRAVGRAGEVAAHGHVQNNVEGVGRQRPPRRLVQLGARQRKVNGVVQRPRNVLLAPVAVGTVPGHGPRVERRRRVEADGRTPPRGLVADAAVGRATAVRRAKGRGHAVAQLQNVELAAQGPARARVDRLAQQPECGPDTLFGSRRAIAHADAALNAGFLAGRRKPAADGLDAAGGPASTGTRRTRVFEGHDLEGAGAAQQQVLGAARVNFGLAVLVKVAGNGFPVFGVGRCAGSAGEGVVPDEGEAGVGGWRSGCDEEAREEGCRRE